jgi:hypothetical protein
MKSFKAVFLSLPSFIIWFTSSAPYMFEINSAITSNSSSFNDETSQRFSRTSIVSTK